MAAEPGGIASKLGHIYERRYAVGLLVRIIGGQLARVRWEPASGEDGGADVELEHVCGSVEHVQVKRQNRADAYWSVASLHRAGVLSSAARLTSGPSPRRFTFVSADPVPHLKDICDQLLRNSASPAEFISKRVNGLRARRECFDELLKRWGLAVGNPAEELIALNRLQSMRFVLLDRGEEGEEQLRLLVELSLTGRSENTVALLAQFLEERLGKDVTAQELLEHLARQGIQPKDLARDPTLPTALHSLRDEFRASLRQRLVAGTWIDRSQVSMILARITAAVPPRVILVHGKPGAGKSGVLLGITDGLVDRDISVLPLSLSSRPPDGSVQLYGETLGLHATPTAALRAMAGHRRAVLLVDQLDALRLTTSGATATWNVCAQMLRSAASDPETVLLVACRTFDLENDANIRTWKQSIEKSDPSGVMAIEIGALQSAEIEPIVSSVGMHYVSMPPRLRSLLQNPNMLNAWHQLATRGAVGRDFATQTQLLAALIDSLRAEIARDHLVPDRDVHEVLESARATMERTGSLRVPASVFDSHRGALKGCCAVGLLVQTGASVSFPHQSFFDHLVAKAALSASGYSAQEILRWIKTDQSLQRRDQLRQLLFTLHDEEPRTAAEVSRLVLDDPSIRFHLKQLVLGVLREAEPISAEHAMLVADFAADAFWAEHVRARVLWRSAAWFDAFHARGVWRTLLANTVGEQRWKWLQTILMVMDQRAQDIDILLEPVLGEPAGLDLVGSALSHDPLEDSPKIATLRNKQIRAGRWGMQDFMFETVAERDPRRAVRLLESATRGLLRHALRAIKGGSDDRIEGFREGVLESAVTAAIMSNSVQSYRTFSRLLQLCERLKTALLPRAETADDLTTRYFRLSSFFSGITDTLVLLTSHAVAGLADADIDRLQGALKSSQLSRSPILRIAVATGLARASFRASDAALGWLCASPERLSLPEAPLRDEHGLAADVIRRHAGTCSMSVLARLEGLLLRLHPESERDRYRYQLTQYLSHGKWGFIVGGKYCPHLNPVGRAQHLLMGAIPAERRSPEVQDRLRVWDAKFGGPAVERSGFESSGGWVGSPIPRDRIKCLADRQWLSIVSRQWSAGRWKQRSPDQIAEASHKHFARDMGEAAKLDPQRFVHLALLLPENAPATYLIRICEALADRATAVGSCAAADLDAFMGRIASTGDQHAIISACRAIEHHPQTTWGESTWKLLQTAVAHEQPKVTQVIVHAIGGLPKKTDIDGTSLNCVRGCAAAALGALAWDNMDRAARVLPMARQLAVDPHPAVRAAALHTAFGIYTVNKDDGVALLVAIAGHKDDDVLAGRWLTHFVQYARWSHPNLVRPVFDRMTRSALPAIAEQGATWVTAEYFQRGSCGDRYAECRNGTTPQRVGVAKSLGHLLHDERVAAADVESELTELFLDSAGEVRHAAAQVFRVDDVLGSAASGRLAIAFARSAGFVEHPEDLLWPLSHKAVDLSPYSSSVLAAADRFAADCAKLPPDQQARVGRAGRDLSSLLLRLYDAATKSDDQSLAEACLDRWDGLLASRIGDVEKLLDSLVE